MLDDNENCQVGCLFDGAPKAGQLPLQIQATLYRGTAVITDETEYRYGSSKNVIHFPGAGQEYLDPLAGLGSFFPAVSAVAWSLINAPYGVGVDLDGAITVAADAALDVVNEITVQAVYRGAEYAKTLRITKVLDGKQGDKGEEGKDGKDGKDGNKGDQDDPSPKYLGKTYEIGTNSGEVDISILNTIQKKQAHEGDWVAYVGPDQPGASPWKNGFCVRRTGNGWVQIPIDVDGNFESSPYIIALYDLTDEAPTGTFLSLLVRKLVADTAMIKELYMQQGVISGDGYITTQG